MNNIENFSLWVDFLEREFIENDLKDLIEKKIARGATSNPAIFKNAFTTSKAYENQKSASNNRGKDLYEELAIKDIQDACDKFADIYNEACNDGFVSLEVDPFYADNTEETVKEGLSLAKRIDRKNLMIKVPATDAGYAAMEDLLKSGVNVNATLVFSNEQTEKCLEAYKRANREDLSLVISVFISRFDRTLDPKLPKDLQGKAGILNGAMCYNTVEAQGFKNVRTLFASTGVKGDSYIPSYYVDELLGKRSVNTAPLGTIEGYVKNGATAEKLPIANEEIEEFFTKISELEVDFNEVSNSLLSEGLEQFKDAFKEILESLK